MADPDPLSRRTFLRLTGVAAGGAVLAACSSDGGGGGGDGGGGGNGGKSDAKGSVTDPIPPPGKYSEAPQLAELVQAGELPPVEERLPATPYVVPHKWLEPGKYGGQIQTSTGDSAASSHAEYMYGHSLLRWLNDGQVIGPGLVETWESNDDATEWILHFREGLKWSDGEPWTTADIMFWWEDMVLNEEHTEGPPDEARSGTGSLMEMTAPDDLTIVMSFDAPAPLTADRLAMWVKRGNGPTWMEPRHYMEQFHPKYNPDVPADWASDDGEFDQKRDWTMNPECPVLTGWRLAEFNEGQSLRFERNPYYWCVDQEGNQLPYIDGIQLTVVDDDQVRLLQVLEGRVNFFYGGFSAVFLSDVSALREAEDESKLRVRFWDAGDGSGSLIFFNQDYKDEKMRELIRNPKFLQALSHAYDREEVQRAVYFNTGELTTGTMSPKAIEFHYDEEGVEAYRQWRDSYLEFNPERAEQLLDEIGVVDSDGDGLREHPDGSKLTVRLDFHADSGREHVQKNEIVKGNWDAIGIDTRMNPVAPTGYDPQWRAGELMTNTNWETGDGPNCLVYPQWMVPIEGARWAPLQGEFYAARGTPKENAEQDVDPYDRAPPRMAPEEGGPIERLWELYDQSKVEVDELERHHLVHEMIKVHIESGPYLIGVCANTPYILLIHDDMRNVPDQDNLMLGGFAAPWIHPSPAVYDPEAWFWDNPEEHSA